MTLKSTVGWVGPSHGRCALGFALALTAACPAWAQSAGPGESLDGAVELSQAPATAFGTSRNRDVLTAQVLLDRIRFAPGEIDGLNGGNTRRAVRAFQRAQGVEVDGVIDGDLIGRLEEADGRPLLRTRLITEEQATGPFLDAVPSGMVAQAKLDRVSYTSPEELLSEAFHMSPGLLRALNPQTDFGRVGARILVVAKRSSELPDVARIEVDKAAKRVRAYAADGKLLASYPATIGSAELPSPSGATQVRAVAPDAAYYFDPDQLSFGPDEKLTIPPGPNNPVGGVWIDLAKAGYGIHGTPSPGSISKTASHGCVRLTNWDARELAAKVRAGVEVTFVGGG